MWGPFENAPNRSIFKRLHEGGVSVPAYISSFEAREVLSEKVRFIKLVIADALKVRNRKRETIIADLRSNNFRTLQELPLVVC